MSDIQAERNYSAVSASTPITALIRERDIQTPEQASPLPLLEQVRRELAKSDGGAFAGITYDLSGGNSLPRDWLLQSPTRWGHRAADLPFYPLTCPTCDRDILLPSCSSDVDCLGGGTCRPIWNARRVCFGHSDALLPPMRDLIASARRIVDITAMQPVPDTRFLGALRAGLDALAASGRPVTVRLLIGQYPPTGIDAKALLAALVSELRDRGGHLTVSVAAMRSCTAFEACNSFSWPHGKIIAVDGREALVGGHNLWSEDYLVAAPVHDVTMRVRGPAAASASRFADRLWQFVCANLDKKPSIQMASYSNGGQTDQGVCPQSLAPQPAPRLAGGVPILAVGRLGAGITSQFANQSELARDLLFGAARHTIFLSQQDIGFTLGRAAPIFPESTLERLIDFVTERNGQVFIVLSNAGSVGKSGLTYSNDVTLAALANHLREVAVKRRGDPAVDNVLCRNFHLASLRFGPDDAWPGGKPIANHAKFWMVDDRAFYIGSDNVYPVNLQEFGYIVDDRRATAEVLEAYWKPLWQWSARAAVSGDGAEPCIFRARTR